MARGVCTSRIGILLSSFVLLMAVIVDSAPAQENGEVDKATKKLMAAQGLYQRGLYKLAAREYEGFLKEHGKHKHAELARYGLALSRYQLGEFEKSSELLADLLKDRNFEHREPALAVMGHCYMQQQEYDDALDAFNALLKKYPKSAHAPGARINRAQALYMRKKYADALDACRDFLKHHPKSPSKSAAVYFAGISRMALKKYPDAIETLRTVLKDHEKSPYALDAKLNLGRCLEATAQLDKAADQYAAFVKSAPDTRVPEGRYALGSVLHRMERYDQAAGELTTLLKKHPEHRLADAARLQLGIVQLDAGNVDDARKTLQHVRKNDKTRATRAAFYLARCDMAQEEYAEARKALGELLKEKDKPANVDEIAYHRAMCAMKLGEYKSAADEFEEFRKRWPDAEETTDSMYRQAYCLYRLKQYADSIELCRKVAKKGDGPVAIPAVELAGENLFLLEQYNQAAETFVGLLKMLQRKDVTATDKRRNLVKLRIGQCHYYNEDYKATIESLGWLKDLDNDGKTPQLKEGLLLLGDAQLKADKHDDAIKTLKNYLDGDPAKKDEARFKLALAQIGDKKTDDARKTLDGLTDDDAKGPWVLRGRLQYAQLLYDAEKLSDAGKQLQTLLDADPESELRAPALYLMGWVDMRQERHALAAKRFGELVEKYPEHPQASDARFQKGEALHRNKSWDAAQDALEEYLKKNPKGEHATRARYLVGVCLAERDKHAEAMKIFASLAADKNTASPNVLYKLAWSARERKDPNTAKASYRNLLKDYPEAKLAVHARSELAGMLYVDKKYKDAAELLKPVVADDKTPEAILPVAIYRLGSSYAKIGKHKEAGETLEAFAKRFTEHKLAPSGLYRAAMAKLEIHKPDEAEKLLSTLLKRHGKHDLAAPALLKLGDAQAASNDFAKAYSTYTTFIKKYPKYDRLYFAQFGAGWSAQNLDKYDDARKWYKNVIDDHNGPTAARAQFQVGECYFAEKQFETAAAELLKVDIVYDYPKWSARALYEAGIAFENAKQFVQAKKQYLALRKRFPKSTPAEMAGKRIEALAKAGY